jgi:hypothetical protein
LLGLAKTSSSRAMMTTTSPSRRRSGSRPSLQPYPPSLRLLHRLLGRPRSPRNLHRPRPRPGPSRLRPRLHPRSRPSSFRHFPDPKRRSRPLQRSLHLRLFTMHFRRACFRVIRRRFGTMTIPSSQGTPKRWASSGRSPTVIRHSSLHARGTGLRAASVRPRACMGLRSSSSTEEAGASSSVTSSCPTARIRRTRIYLHPFGVARTSVRLTSRV